MDEETIKLIRTDFSDDTSWEALVEVATRENAIGFAGEFELVEDEELEGLEPVELAERFPDDAFLLIADDHAFSDQSWPILCYDTDSDREFRVPAKDAWGIESNLGTGNMDFDEMMEMTDEDGVFMVPAPA